MTSATNNNPATSDNQATTGAQVAVSPGPDYSTMEQFLKIIERRAFHMARLRTGTADAAMDIVQDSMYKLVEKYSHKSSKEWKPLFYRILNSKVTDYYRRKVVRDRIFFWTSNRGNEEELGNIIENSPASLSENPDKMLHRQQRITKIAKAVDRLPRRQREAFMLRCWEGMSTIETAKSMDCSEGSVKTHYSRAMHSLREYLEEYQND